jgi:hypothetical protein
MPLVRTPMIGPTKAYDYAPTLSPEEAAEMVVDAIIHKQSRVATDMGKFQQVWNLISPKSYAAAMNSTFRMFEDPHEAKDKKPALEAPKEPSSEQVAMASLLKGVHY